MIVSTTEVAHAEVLAALRRALQQRGIREFAVFDHAAAAEAAGLELAPEAVVVFGNPLVGTKLMQLDPRTGLDLPLRILLRATPEGTEIAHHDPRELAASYALDGGREVLDQLAGLLAALTEEIAG